MQNLDILVHVIILYFRVMQITIDSTKVDKGPLLDNRVHMSLYYVCFVVVFSFFFLNIFVALIIVTFQERGERELTGCELTKNQVGIKCAFLEIQAIICFKFGSRTTFLCNIHSLSCISMLEVLLLVYYIVRLMPEHSHSALQYTMA